MLKVIAILSCLFLLSGMLPDNPDNTPEIQLGMGNKVVFLTANYSRYLQDLKAGHGNIDSLYSYDIKYPVTRYFASSEYARLMAYQFYAPPQDTTGLAMRIAMLDNERHDIEDSISAVLARCKKYLKDDSITIYISPAASASEILKKMGGVTGFTAGSKKILITIDPTVITWKAWLPFAVAHEFNHAYWTKMNFSTTHAWDFLSYLVFEGRADYYAHLIYPSKTPAWDTALSQQQKTDLWNSIKLKLNTTDINFEQSVMFGYGGYPLWGGYCLGYSIVQSALKKNPGLTPEQWTNMTARQILQMSDYK